MRSKYFLAIAMAVALAVSAAAPAGASTLTRTFVSSTGSDANPCTVAQPCATFAAAYSAVAQNGIVAALDPGKYGPLNITGPVTIVRLPGNGHTDWEVELVVVVGKAMSHVAEQDAWDHVAGLTVGQDISERRVQFRKPGPHLAMAKSFPTFGPTGPWLVTPDEFADPDDIGLTCAVNGEPMQDSRTSLLIFGVPALIESISAMVPLLPGDLIFTGTPAGVGSTRDPRRYLAPGDVITSEIEGIGLIRNTCVEGS